MSISCQECRERLSELLDAEDSTLPNSLSKARLPQTHFNPITNGLTDRMAPANAYPEMAAHLATCPGCACDLAFLRSIRDEMHSLPKMAAPSNLRARVRSQLEQASVAAPLLSAPKTLFVNSQPLSTPSANGVANGHYRERPARQPSLLDTFVSFFSRPLNMATGGVALAVFCLVLLTHEQSSTVVPSTTVAEEQATPAAKTVIKTAAAPAAHQNSVAHKAQPAAAHIAATHVQGRKAHSTNTAAHVTTTTSAPDESTSPADVSLPRLDATRDKQIDRRLADLGRTHLSTPAAGGHMKPVHNPLNGGAATAVHSKPARGTAGTPATAAPTKADTQPNATSSHQETTAPNPPSLNNSNAPGMYAKGTEVSTPLVHLALLPTTVDNNLPPAISGSQETTTLSQNPVPGPTGQGSETVTDTNVGSTPAAPGPPLVATVPRTDTHHLGTPRVRSNVGVAPNPSLSFGIAGETRRAQLTVIAPQDLNDVQISIALSSGLRYTDQQTGGYRVVWSGSAHQGQAIPITLDLVAITPGDQELRVRLLQAASTVGATGNATNSPNIISSQTVVLNVSAR
ncbi:MAG: hypothetical protein JO316_19300 [Abitibacteriaceae bacterium]|nr:hypothetical protein [Abditibacteriaceae bacterium]MBV9867504.1 hypothetical protein [Abditibacteriaceae bacterium]